jgi:anti-sigma regulatory factor (Ser/Thr protein kinase)
MEEVTAVGTVIVPFAPASVSVARQRLTAELRAAGVVPAAILDAALVASELLSNAIRHARPLPGENLQFSWVLAADTVEVAVRDGGAATRPWPAHASVSALGGRGLDIVGHLSTRWGVRAEEEGLTVWAVVAAPADAPRACAGRHRSLISP